MAEIGLPVGLSRSSSAASAPPNGLDPLNLLTVRCLAHDYGWQSSVGDEACKTSCVGQGAELWWSVDPIDAVVCTHSVPFDWHAAAESLLCSARHVASIAVPRVVLW